MMNYSIVDKIINTALEEDIPYGDISSECILSEDSLCSADLICKEDGVIAGLPVFSRVFHILGGVSCEFFACEGDDISKGKIIARVVGNTINVLKGERVALNLIQRLSGVATLTKSFVGILENSNTKLLDTRKTTPGLRYLEKYAVTIGGGYNHRFNLSDGIMLKDNHIAAAGSIKKAVEAARKNTSFVRKIEVETENLDMVKQAIDAKVDIIMLDNMDNETMKKALEIIGDKAITECSGNITLDRLKSLSTIGVDYISSGALTHSYKALDLSLKNLKIQN